MGKNFSDSDVIANPSAAQNCARILDVNVSRRRVLQGASLLPLLSLPLGCATTVSASQDTGEIGFALSPTVWGTGVFRETADLYVNFLFSHWPLPTLTGRTLARNHPGLRP